MTTRQEQFKAEMAAIFKKYSITMEVEEEHDSYSTYVKGISFYPWMKSDSEDRYKNIIDFRVGNYSTAESFEE